MKIEIRTKKRQINIKVNQILGADTARLMTFHPADTRRGADQPLLLNDS